MGFSRIATCADCHTAHQIHPAGDARSSVGPANRLKTCQKCHPGATANFARYDPHANTHDKGRSRLLWATALFMRILLAGVFAFFGIHTLLWFPRSVKARVEARRRRGREREKDDGPRTPPAPAGADLGPALRPVRPLAAHPPHGELPRALAHGRAAAVLGEALGGDPLAPRSAASGRRRRSTASSPSACSCASASHLARLFKRLFGDKEYGDPLGAALAGSAAARPRATSCSTCAGFSGEASVRASSASRTGKNSTTGPCSGAWGSSEAPGLILWVPKFWARFLPGDLFNVALLVHGEEALLAVVFIFTIHFFNGHLRPEKFPMDTVIFTGVLPLEELKHERPAEYERLVRGGRRRAPRGPGADRRPRPEEPDRRNDRGFARPSPRCVYTRRSLELKPRRGGVT